MPFCINCGVWLEDNVEKCPLCSFVFKDSLKQDIVQPLKNISKYYSDIKNLKKERNVFIIEILSVFFAICDISVLIIDYILNKSFSWSIYSVISITAFWIYLIFMLLLAKNFGKTLLITTLITIALLTGIDLVDKKIDWLFNFALPICISTALIVFFIFKIIKYIKRYSFAIFCISFGICLEVSIIDLFISLHNGKIMLSWSLIVSACLSPVVCVSLIHFIFFSHYFDLRKYFHV